MSEMIRQYFRERHDVIEGALHSCLPVSDLAGAEKLNSAIHYAVFPGGRRMRPMLTFLAAEICGGNAVDTLRAAVAVEFLHAASLTLDDLPCMDDAGLRRGRAATHVLFGADVALLAALALLNQAYAFFAETPGLLARATNEIGASHMIGGQAVDVAGEDGACRMEKTTALMRLTMAAGATAAGACAGDERVLISFGNDLGEAYQICDDLADAFGSDDETGKTCGQDWRRGRGSAVNEFGATGARELADQLVERACSALRDRFGESRHSALLVDFARSVLLQERVERELAVG